MTPINSCRWGQAYLSIKLCCLHCLALGRPLLKLALANMHALSRKDTNRIRLRAEHAEDDQVSETLVVEAYTELSMIW